MISYLSFGFHKMQDTRLTNAMENLKNSLAQSKSFLEEQKKNELRRADFKDIMEQRAQNSKEIEKLSLPPTNTTSLPLSSLLPPSLPQLPPLNLPMEQYFYVEFYGGCLVNTLLFDKPTSGNYVRIKLTNLELFVLEIVGDKVDVFCYANTFEECEKQVVRRGTSGHDYQLYNIKEFIPDHAQHKPKIATATFLVYEACFTYEDLINKCFNEWNKDGFRPVDRLMKLEKEELFRFVVNFVNENAKDAWKICFGKNNIDLLVLKELDKRELVYFILKSEEMNGFDKPSIWTLLPNYEFYLKKCQYKNKDLIMVIDNTEKDMVINNSLYEDNVMLRRYVKSSCDTSDVNIIDIVTLQLEQQYVVIKVDEEWKSSWVLQASSVEDCKKVINDGYMSDGCNYYVVDLNQFNICMNDDDGNHEEENKIIEYIHLN